MPLVASISVSSPMICWRISRLHRKWARRWLAESILTSRACAGWSEGVIALSALPGGFTASELAAHVCAISGQSQSQYGPRRAGYDLKKLRGKLIVRRIGQTRRYEPLPVGLRAMTALVVLRNKAIKPLLAAAQEFKPPRGAQNPRPVDTHYHTIRVAMQGVFHELGIAA
jgi:hypothetical protein